MSRARRLHPTTLVLVFALVLASAAVTLSNSRGVFSDTTDNPGNSFTAAASFGIAQVQKASVGTSGNASSVTASFGSGPTQDNLLILVHHTGTLAPSPSPRLGPRPSLR